MCDNHVTFRAHGAVGEMKQDSTDEAVSTTPPASLKKHFKNASYYYCFNAIRHLTSFPLSLTLSFQTHRVVVEQLHNLCSRPPTGTVQGCHSPIDEEELLLLSHFGFMQTHAFGIHGP